MPSTVRRDLAEAALDHRDLGQLCLALVGRACADLEQAGFETVSSSSASIEDKPFGVELLAYARLRSLDGATPVVVCARLTCTGTKPLLVCTGTFELHRTEELVRPARDGESLMGKLTLAHLDAPRSADQSEQDFSAARHADLLLALQSRLEALSADEFSQFVNETLAP